MDTNTVVADTASVRNPLEAFRQQQMTIMERAEQEMAEVVVEATGLEVAGEQRKQRRQYAVAVGWDIQTSAQTCYRNIIPANVVSNFDYYLAERQVDYQGNKLYDHYRYPEAQIEDLSRVSKHFVHLPELTDVSRDAAKAISKLIHLPWVCSKYPVELKQRCSTCWYEYLFNDAPQAVNDSDLTFEEKEAAIATINRLRDGLESAIEQSKQYLDEALRDLEDPKSPKSRLIEFDLNNAFNLHAERPRYRTTAERNTTVEDFATVMSNILNRPSTDQGALLAQINELKAELESLKAKNSPEEADRSVDVKERMAKLRDKKKSIEPVEA